MADALVTVFLEKLLNTLVEETRYVNEFKEQFLKLQNDLQFMQCFLKEADRVKRKNNNAVLRNVMANLRELIYEAEDILADCLLQSREDGEDGSNGLLSCIYPSKLQFQYKTGKRLREINDKISHIRTNIQSFLGIPVITQVDVNEHNDQMDRWSSPVYDHTQVVVGLEDDTRKLKDWLFEANEGLLAIGVVGMGGLGKTTIAQKVYNERDIENHFERRIWVSVSQTFTEEQIMRSILRNLGDASVGDDRGELLRKIHHYLLGKSYLIVMDDVWSKDTAWWNRICQGLPKGRGSSIIITTRILEVAQKMGGPDAKMHFPKFLSKADSWLLFRNIAFARSGGRCPSSELEVVGEEIVDKCKGLPLAIKAVAGIMLYKPPRLREWRKTQERFREELAERDDSVMASLQLSYDELPPYLKSCFLSFAVYPEDCEVMKEQLVHWWIGEGFVRLRNGISSVEAGEDCFAGLSNRCLVEVVDRTYNKSISTCKIHDMVRDLVIKVAEDDAFFCPKGHGSRHLGLSSEINTKQLTTNQKLRALVSTTKTAEVNKFTSTFSTKLDDCQYMRVLDLSRSIFDMSLTSLLYRVGSLQHLAYLGLSNTHPLIYLPPSLENLRNLQILDLSYCQNLKLLPSYIITLTKLRVLDISNCGSLYYLPKGLGQLSNLEVLLGFRPARPHQSEGCRIFELSNLTHLRTLGLQLGSGDEIGDNELQSLENLSELQFLSICCFDSHGNDLVAKLDRLCPPKQLDELSLSFYPGNTSPEWLNPITLPTLRFLSVCSGNIAEMHQSFWGDWKIEALKLESLADLGMEWVDLQGVMPSLQIVNVCWCPQLEGFPIEDAGFRGGVWTKEDHWIPS